MKAAGFCGWIAFPAGKAALGLLAVLLALTCLADSPPSPQATRESAATLVVFNKDFPSSADLAEYYAQRRGIPDDHVIGLSCPATEEITRAQYDEIIAEPLRAIFRERGWWHEPANPSGQVTDNQIRFIALIRGIPLKIANAQNYPGDTGTGFLPALSTNAAAVDSELSTLGVRTRQITGPLKNPYYRSFRPFMDTPLPSMMLVCRLDGPTPETVRGMIDGALEAERDGLNGYAYVDMRGITSGPMAMGDTWLSTAAADLRRYGMPVVWDTLPALFPADYPMKHAAIYLGWYTDSVAGPMARDDFRFEPGAIAVHIHSFSAFTVRDPHSNWAGPLLAHGAAATLGNVYEPYLLMTPNLDIFVDRLRNGLTFAESAYASEAVLSWMTTFLGDPLYRPFLATDYAAENGARPAIEYAAYRRGARTWYEKGQAQGQKELASNARALQSGIVWEGLGLLQWSVPDGKDALASLRQAEKCFGPTEDGLRTALQQAEILKEGGSAVQARAFAAKALDRYRQIRGASLLRQIIGLPSPDHGG